MFIRGARAFARRMHIFEHAKRCNNICGLCLVCTIYLLLARSWWMITNVQLLYLHPNTTTKLCDFVLFAILGSFSWLNALYFVAWVCIRECVCVFNATNTDFKTGFWLFVIISFSFMSGFSFCFKSKEKIVAVWLNSLRLHSISISPSLKLLSTVKHTSNDQFN